MISSGFFYALCILFPIFTNSRNHLAHDGRVGRYCFGTIKNIVTASEVFYHATSLLHYQYTSCHIVGIEVKLKIAIKPATGYITQVYRC